jgi:DNA-binding NtrC family response regulator
LLSIPSLAERKEDIPPLVQRFVETTAGVIGHRVSGFDGDLLSWLRSLSWPGEIRELKAVVMASAVASTLRREPLRDLIEERRALWDEETAGAGNNQPPHPFLAAKAVELSGHNYRLAAARLGCSLDSLHKLLNTPEA